MFIVNTYNLFPLSKYQTTDVIKYFVGQPYLFSFFNLNLYILKSFKLTTIKLDKYED